MFAKLKVTNHIKKSTTTKIKENQDRRRHVGTRLYGQAIENSYKKIRSTPKLRPSSFPNCPIVLYIEFLKAAHENGFYETATASSDYFTSVGTIAHEVVQYHMGFSNMIYGNWSCINLKCKHGQAATTLYNEKGEITKKPVLTALGTVNNICPSCKEGMRYEEIQVIFNGITGHIDCIIKLPNGKYWVLDYKTTTKYAIQNKHMPYVSHIAQVGTYALGLEKKGFEIEGFSLLYFTRDNPFEFLECPIDWTKKAKRLAINTVKKETIIFNTGVKAFKEGDRNLALEKKPCDCKQYHDKFICIYEPCTYVDVCFNPDKLNRVINQKERLYTFNAKQKDIILKMVE